MVPDARDQSVSRTPEQAWAEVAGTRPADLPDGYMIIEEDIIVPSDFFEGPSAAATYAPKTVILW